MYILYVVHVLIIINIMKVMAVPVGNGVRLLKRESWNCIQTINVQDGRNEKVKIAYMYLLIFIMIDVLSSSSLLFSLIM